MEETKINMDHLSPEAKMSYVSNEVIEETDEKLDQAMKEISDLGVMDFPTEEMDKMMFRIMDKYLYPELYHAAEIEIEQRKEELMKMSEKERKQAEDEIFHRNLFPQG